MCLVVNYISCIFLCLVVQVPWKMQKRQNNVKHSTSFSNNDKEVVSPTHAQPEASSWSIWTMNPTSPSWHNAMDKSGYLHRHFRPLVTWITFITFPVNHNATYPHFWHTKKCAECITIAPTRNYPNPNSPVKSSPLSKNRCTTMYVYVGFLGFSSNRDMVK